MPIGDYDEAGLLELGAVPQLLADPAYRAFMASFGATSGQADLSMQTAYNRLLGQATRQFGAYAPPEDADRKDALRAGYRDGGLYDIEFDKAAERTVEEELEEQLTEEEIENFQIEKVDMERLTNKICDILAERESDGMLQSELWKKLKLSSRDGSRLSLKLERMGTINREKLLENDRWTYKLILKKTPISTQSIENSPCLVCTVEQKCSLDGEISPKTCQLIEDWVLAEYKKPSKAKK